MKRWVYLDWYNHPRLFNNGVIWFRVHVRIGRWREIGGLRFCRSRSMLYVQLLRPDPDGPQSPVRSIQVR